MKTALRFQCAGILIWVVSSSVAFSEVKDASAGGFTVEIVLDVEASPDKVFQTIIHSIGQWWDSSHTFSGSSDNLYLEAVPGGCFCERLPSGGGVRHLEVVFVDPGKRLNLAGGLGPLQTMAVSGAMTLALSPLESETRVQLVYAVGGYSKDGLAVLAPAVDSVLQEQLGRLKNLVERGDPAVR